MALPPNNGAVLTIAKIIKAVMSSAAEAELWELFINCKESIPSRQALGEMGHTQPPTPMQTDNSLSADVYPPLSIADKKLDEKSRGLFCIMHGQ